MSTPQATTAHAPADRLGTPVGGSSATTVSLHPAATRPPDDRQGLRPGRRVRRARVRGDPRLPGRRPRRSDERARLPRASVTRTDRASACLTAFARLSAQTNQRTEPPRRERRHPSSSRSTATGRSTASRSSAAARSRSSTPAEPAHECVELGAHTERAARTARSECRRERLVPGRDLAHESLDACERRSRPSIEPLAESATLVFFWPAATFVWTPRWRRPGGRPPPAGERARRPGRRPRRRPSGCAGSSRVEAFVHAPHGHLTSGDGHGSRDASLAHRSVAVWVELVGGGENPSSSPGSPSRSRKASRSVAPPASERHRLLREGRRHREPRAAEQQDTRQRGRRRVEKHGQVGDRLRRSRHALDRHLRRSPRERTLTAASPRVAQSTCPGGPERAVELPLRSQRSTAARASARAVVIPQRPDEGRRPRKRHAGCVQPRCRPSLGSRESKLKERPRWR